MLVDVPEIKFTVRDGYGQGAVERQRTIASHTRSFGAGAIYSINWCDEAAAKLAAQQIEHAPIDIYSLESALLSMSDGDRKKLLAGPVVRMTRAIDADDAREKERP